ncbi:cysteine--tRNA ligase [Sphingomonas sp. AOB5]|uniref:cysteine--tRNA ligase n=1 Tax=Sphingomonas sp. AOB5 TaxID=3034017 RepID=UPI0023F8011B|nr:cysteine--tRNA ligase [Sphingomonas sp. AOB5]MDF7775510.1 cysteine--tRNA ligase [Sphingomonas sp. AOB5]
MNAAPLTLYNSITRSLERFEPLDPAKGVRVYSCGPTVYSDPHLGNLRAYVFTDTLSRVLTWKGNALTHVINITDVGHLTSDADAGEDKMEAAARKQGLNAWDISRHYADVFRRNLADLNIRKPTHMPLATEYVERMIAFAAEIAPKHCYEIESGLYFDSRTVPDYGRLAGSQGDIGEGRIDPVEGKRHPQDFAIWRKTPVGETRQMEWDSPWGRGAPGWHLECSVMSSELLGLPFDIHTGGIDHREIHHVNEIAQNQAHCSCADSGAHFWMHNNFLVDRDGKMSKSKGGIATLDALVARGVHPLAYRLMCLSAHYRSELEFSPDNLGAALTRLKRLVMTVSGLKARIGDGGSVAGAYRARLDEAVADDLNTPRALPVLDELLADKKLSAEDRIATLAEFDAVLGLDLTNLTREALRVRPAEATLTAAEIDLRLADRKQARVDKDFARSDAIRDELAASGVEVMDGDPLGWDWKAAL